MVRNRVQSTTKYPGLLALSAFHSSHDLTENSWSSVHLGLLCPTPRGAGLNGIVWSGGWDRRGCLEQRLAATLGLSGHRWCGRCLFGRRRRHVQFDSIIHSPLSTFLVWKELLSATKSMLERKLRLLARGPLSGRFREPMMRVCVVAVEPESKGEREKIGCSFDHLYYTCTASKHHSRHTLQV
jgi:hypothetical protein